MRKLKPIATIACAALSLAMLAGMPSRLQAQQSRVTNLRRCSRLVQVADRRRCSQADEGQHDEGQQQPAEQPGDDPEPARRPAASWPPRLGRCLCRPHLVIVTPGRLAAGLTRRKMATGW